MPDTTQRLITAVEGKYADEAKTAIMAILFCLPPPLAMAVLSSVVGEYLAQITPNIADLPARLDLLRDCAIEVYAAERLREASIPRRGSNARH